MRVSLLTLMALCLVAAAAPLSAEPCAGERRASATYLQLLKTADDQEQSLKAQMDTLRGLLARGPHMTDQEIATSLYSQQERLEAARYHWPGGPVSAANWNDWIELTQEEAVVAYLQQLQTARAAGNRPDPDNNPLIARVESAENELARLSSANAPMRNQARGAQLAAIDCIVRNQGSPPQVAQTTPPSSGDPSQVTTSQQPETYGAGALPAQRNTGGRIRYRPMSQGDATAMAGAVAPAGGGAQPQELEDFHLKGFWEVQSMQNGPWEAIIEIDLNPYSHLLTASNLRTGRVTELRARGNDVITAEEWLLSGTISPNRNEVHWNDGQVWRRTDKNPLLSGGSP